ncbi:MAG: hypothetical protein IPJ65_38020 [Archangiaceae bacterium]|nr:hypothetical protein [Archangiaceae bacterium]
MGWDDEWREWDAAESSGQHHVSTASGLDSDRRRGLWGHAQWVERGDLRRCLNAGWRGDSGELNDCAEGALSLAEAPSEGSGPALGLPLLDGVAVSDARSAVMGLRARLLGVDDRAEFADGVLRQQQVCRR